MRLHRSALIRSVVAGSLIAGGLTLAAPPAYAADITTAGPLTKITTTPDLNCAVNYTGDSFGNWYSDIACATLIAVGGNLFGPGTIPAGGGATSAVGYTPYTPVSQTGMTGTGTAADPYKIVTVVRLGTTGLSATQTDTYVTGQEHYRTDVTVNSASSVGRNVVVYRAGDCYLQDSDYGMGGLLAGVSPICKALPTSTDPNRIVGFQPLTSGSRYMEGGFSEVWAAVGTQASLPNTIRDDAADEHDNGIAISWASALPAGTGQTFSSLNFFSPLGRTPLTMSAAVTPGTVAGGAQVAYTVTITNPGNVPAVVPTFQVELPAGFSYVAGSGSGAVTAAPTVSGQTLTFTGPVTVPAGGSVTQTFSATASSVPGTYAISSSATCTDCTVVPAENIAPVTVTAAPEPSESPSPSVSPSPSPSVSPSPSESPSPSVSPSPSTGTSPSPSTGTSPSPSTWPSPTSGPTTWTHPPHHTKPPVVKDKHGGLARTGA